MPRVGAGPVSRGAATPADVAAGRAAGVRVLGVATGRTTTAELDKAGATVTITGLEDLQPLRALVRR